MGSITGPLPDRAYYGENFDEVPIPAEAHRGLDDPNFWESPQTWEYPEIARPRVCHAYVILLIFSYLAHFFMKITYRMERVIVNRMMPGYNHTVGKECPRYFITCAMDDDEWAYFKDQRACDKLSP